MSEMITIARDELDHLNERARKSAMDKSYLQLVIRLMNRVSAASGLEDTVDCTLRNILDVMGGANIILYYWIDGATFYADVYGKKMQLDTIDDTLVQQVIASRELIEHEQPFSDTMMLTPEFTKAYTWVYPLVVGPDIIGVFKLENLHIGMRDLYQYLPTFFSFVALILKNEILGYTSLQQAYDQLNEANTELKMEINERERTEGELRKAKEELEAANKELEAFCYSVSHDLRAPLRHIDGYVDLLVSRCRDGLSDKGLHYVDTIADSARRMGALIDDLLQFSRTGRAEIRRKRMEMSQALQEALADMKESYPGRAIEWNIGALPSVRGDYALLRQVWANLLGNAVKYTQSRESARIEVSAREEKGEIIFAVSDNGVGFDMRYADKLFGVFQRLHPQEEIEGTGIGLAIVQRIISRHGGRVWAEAEPDRGATFFFTLPTFKEENHA